MERGSLGFRDLQLFNLALLAKQLWRLLYYPSSLLARILKSRYYRNTSPLEVEKSNAPSFGWRSIIAAKDLLKKGLRRTIGTGDTTLVWRDQWIPAEQPRLPKDSGMYQDPLLFVSQLMDPISKEWKLDKLVDLFDIEDINLILSIRPSRFQRPDGFCWTYSKTGRYSVKTGYELAVQLKDLLAPQQIVQPSTDAIKSKIWTIKASHKLKHFAWCGTEEETINHMIFECPPAVETWNLSGIPKLPEIFPRPSLFYNLDYLLWRAREKGATETSLEPFPWIMWYIWKAQAWKTAQLTPAPVENNTTADQSPTEATLVIRPRCQVDASWVYNSSFFGGGFIIDTDEDAAHTGGLTSSQVSIPLQAEFRSLIWAMKMVKQLGFSSMRFESDCLELVRLLDDEDDWPSLAAEIEEYCSTLVSFQFCSLVYIPCVLNVRADALAKAARARENICLHVNSTQPLELATIANSNGIS
ncbi:unnamed protein product [Microthlaspi erraticum]|uniref:RNase H type-1 domain-containing protein n=1 Tax=Microthlaspi erraticum TaxID=1685480 RepID=A0A6D2J029_9BRAS|nr:unnamed protein product [Microthlaspi erraticum]